MRIKRTIVAAATAVGALTATSTLAYAMSFAGWSPAVNAESVSGTSVSLNTAALEGCAFVAQRDDILYFASTRAGGQGGFDIWYSLRGADGAWGDPVNFTAVNTSADELCPAAHRNGKTFLFVRSGGICGGDDIFVTRLHTTRGWAEPTNLGCTVNSNGNEASPSFVGTELYFSSTRAGGPGGADIWLSAYDGASFGAPALVPGLNTTLNDNRPNLRRDGLEIFFDSNRAGGDRRPGPMDVDPRKHV
ncbi:MAG: hypothetical protein ABI555_08765 [Chloroflexota bacterium]